MCIRDRSKAMDIANQLIDKKDIRKAMMFLQRYGIQMNLANKIFKRYGNDIYKILEQKDVYKRQV